MSMILMVIISIVVSGFIFGILGFLARMFIVGGELRRAQDAAVGQLRRAEARNREILVEAKENALKIKSQAQSEINNDRRGIQKLESSLEAREENLKKQNNELHKKTNEVNKKDQDLESERKTVQALESNQVSILEELSKFSAAEAKELLIDKTNKNIEFELAKVYKNAESQMYSEADDKAKEILASSMQRYASEVVRDSSVSSINLPNEEMKGRIIGREGRNIRAIENSTGVDLIVDEEPESVSVSCFDPIRKQTAIVAINSLIKDGRIHPARIEELVEKAVSIAFDIAL